LYVVFCCGFANLLDYKKRGGVCKTCPSKPLISRVPRRGCLRKGFLEAGLKHRSWASNIALRLQFTERIPGSGIETLIKIIMITMVRSLRKGFLEAGLKHSLRGGNNTAAGVYGKDSWKRD